MYVTAKYARHFLSDVQNFLIDHNLQIADFSRIISWLHMKPFLEYQSHAKICWAQQFHSYSLIKIIE